MRETLALTYVGERLRPRGRRLEWIPSTTFAEERVALRWLTEGGADRRIVTSAHRLGLPEELRTGRPRRFKLRRRTPMTADSLYTRLGEDQGLGAVVEAFYARVLADPEITPYFERLSEEGRAHLRWHMRAFLAAATGGPQNYAGRDLTTAHGHLGITAPHFDRVAGHLVNTLREYEVAPEDVSAVEAAVVPLKVQIVSA